MAEDCLLTEDEEYIIDEFCEVGTAGIFGFRAIAHKRNEDTFSESIAAPLGSEKGIINGVKTGSLAASAANWRTIDQDIEIADGTQGTEASRENGTLAYPVTLNLTMHFGSDPVRNAKIRNLADKLKRINTVFEVTMQDGSRRLYGRKNGLRGTAGDDTTGKAMGDLKGIVVTLTGKEPEPWCPVRINEDVPANIATGYSAITVA